jgi:PAS domain S-box-containing protein
MKQRELPHPEELEHQRVTTLVRRLLFAFATALLGVTTMQLTFTSAHLIHSLGLMLCLGLCWAGVRMVDRGYARGAAAVVTGIAFLAANVSNFLDPTPLLFGSIYLLAIVVSGLALSTRTTAFLGATTVLSILGVDLAHSFGRITLARPPSEPDFLITLAIIVALVTLTIVWSAQASERNLRARRQSEAFSQAVVRALPDLVLTLDKEHRIVDFIAGENQQFEANTVVAEPLLCALRAGEQQSWPIEYPVLTETGQRWVDARQLITEENNLLIIRDITDRIESARSEQQFHTLLTEIATEFMNRPADDYDAVIELTLARIGTFFQVDRTSVFIFSEDGSTRSNTHEWCAEGVSSEKAVLQNLQSSVGSWWTNQIRKNRPLIIPRVDDMQEEAKLAQEALQKQGVKALLVVPMTEDDQVKGYVAFDSTAKEREWSGEMVTLLQMLAHYVLAALRHKVNNQAIRESELKHRLLFEQNHDGILIVKENKIVACNPMAAILHGLEESNKLIGKDPWMLGPEYQPNGERTADIGQKAIEKATTLGKRVPLDLLLTHDPTSGATFHADVSVGIIQMGEKVHVHLVIRDITHRKEAEEDLARLIQVETANRAKSQFLSSMSHEIRTPMNAILGYAQLLQQETDLTPRQQGHLKTINRSGAHLLAILNDVLDMAKIESGEMSSDLTETDLSKLILEVERMFRLRSFDTDIRFRLEVDSLPEVVMTDGPKVRQILVNLLGNAFKFTDSGAVTLRGFTERIVENTYRIHLEVEDTGAGVEAHNLESIFDPFEQSPGNEHKEGTGLGLSVCRRFARLLGGDLIGKSVVGRGSTFRLTFEAEGYGEIPIPIRQQTRLTLHPSVHPPHVLVVDDKAENREILRQMLNTLGLFSTEASSGQEAIRAVKLLSPDLILLDLRMPDMDGFMVMNELQKDPEFNVPIVIVSASLRQEKPLALGAGATSFLRKPYSEQSLIRTLKDTLKLTFTDDEFYTQSAKADSKPATIEDLNLVPLVLREQLCEAAASSDIATLQELIEQVRGHTPLLASRLQALSDSFQYEQIIEIATDI